MSNQTDPVRVREHPGDDYGRHTARPTGESDLGLLAIATDEGVTGHAFLGTSSNPASLDGPSLIRFFKPILMGHKGFGLARNNIRAGYLNVEPVESSRNGWFAGSLLEGGSNPPI